MTIIQAIQTKTLFILTLSMLLVSPVTGVYAQDNNDEVKSLGEILNPELDYGNDGKPLTAEIMANYYYNRCKSTESLAFSETEMETLCACSAAEMSKVLTVDEFKVLYVDSRKGLDARGKAIAYGYVPCMEYALRSKFSSTCAISKRLNNVVVGKKQICKCATDSFMKETKETAPMRIMEGIKYDPMTLNPLEHYFTTYDYPASFDSHIKYCRFKDKYKRQNK